LKPIPPKEPTVADTTNINLKPIPPKEPTVATQPAKINLKPVTPKEKKEAEKVIRKYNLRKTQRNNRPLTVAESSKILKAKDTLKRAQSERFKSNPVKISKLTNSLAEKAINHSISSFEKALSEPMPDRYDDSLYDSYTSGPSFNFAPYVPGSSLESSSSSSRSLGFAPTMSSSAPSYSSSSSSSSFAPTSVSGGKTRRKRKNKKSKKRTSKK